MKGAGLTVPNTERLAEKLAAAASGSREPMLIPLSVVGLAYSMLGSPVEIHQPMWRFMAESPKAVAVMKEMWATIEGSHGFHMPIGPLTGWLNDAGKTESKAVKDCWEVIAGIDLLATARQADGELLGPLYVLLTSKSVRQARGMFYTPMHLSKAIAMMTDIQEGMSVMDPCCGSGGMFVAAGQVMKEAGRDPRLVHWVGNDIDPIAVALCAVNLAATGMGPNVTLTVGNALDVPRDEELPGVFTVRSPAA